MTETFDKRNRFAMSANKDKTSDARHAKWPDRKGSGLVHCPLCDGEWEAWFSGWLKKRSDTGEPFLSGSLEPKHKRQAPPSPGNAYAEAKGRAVVPDDDIPF